MAVERAALHRTRWAAPDPVPAAYRMFGGSEIRLKEQMDLQTLIRLIKDLHHTADEISWEMLIARECPFGMSMEPIRYSDDED